MANNQKNLNTYFEEEVITTKMRTFKNDYHVLKVKENTVENLLEKLNKSTKKGAKFTTKQQHMKLCEFILKKAKLRKDVEKIEGEQWERSMRSMLWEVFKEKWDKDFDKTGKEAQLSMPKAKERTVVDVALGPSDAIAVFMQDTDTEQTA